MNLCSYRGEAKQTADDIMNRLDINTPTHFIEFRLRMATMCGKDFGAFIFEK